MDKGSMVLALVDKYTGGNKAQFANMLGVSAQTISAWINRKTFDAELIFTKCRDVSPTWLLSGTGEILISKKKEGQPITKTDDPQKGIPLIPVEAMAGALSGLNQTIMEYQCDHYVIPMFKGAEFLIQVKGDSMLPKYYSGDIVACKRLPMDTFFQWNRTYVIDSEQGALIKKIKPGKDEKHITLVSENPEYEPFELAREQIYSLALVIGVVRAE